MCPENFWNYMSNNNIIWNNVGEKICQNFFDYHLYQEYFSLPEMYFPLNPYLRLLLGRFHVTTGDAAFSDCVWGNNRPILYSLAGGKISEFFYWFKFRLYISILVLVGTLLNLIFFKWLNRNMFFSSVSYHRLENNSVSRIQDWVE